MTVVSRVITTAAWAPWCLGPLGPHHIGSADGGEPLVDAAAEAIRPGGPRQRVAEDGTHLGLHRPAVACCSDPQTSA